MLIGRIVKSNSHVDYVCHVFGPGEVPQPPSPEDYAFGRFVRIPVGGRAVPPSPYPDGADGPETRPSQDGAAARSDRDGSDARRRVDGLVQTHLVGVIYNTVLVNPDYGSGGPRLSPETELEVLSPDYLNERAVLVGIVALGAWLRPPSIGAAHAPPLLADHGVPPVAPAVNAEVETMTADEVARFHAQCEGGSTADGETVRA